MKLLINVFAALVGQVGLAQLWAVAAEENESLFEEPPIFQASNLLEPELLGGLITR